MIHYGRIWNTVSLFCCHTGLTAEFPVDLLYFLAHIRKNRIQISFNASTLLGKKKKFKKSNLNMLRNFLLTSVCCTYPSLLFVFLLLPYLCLPSLPHPTLSTLMSPESNCPSIVLLSTCKPDSRAEDKGHVMKRKIFSPFSPQKKLAGKNTN